MYALSYIVSIDIILQITPPPENVLSLAGASGQSEVIGDQSIMHQTFIEQAPSTPDCVQTEHGLQLTPAGRYQVTVCSKGLQKGKQAC